MGELLTRAVRQFDCFITIDRSIEYQRRMPIGLSMVVLRVPDNKPETVLGLSEEILGRLATIRAGDIVRIDAR